MNTRETDIFSNMKEKLSKASNFGHNLEVDNSEKKNKAIKRERGSEESVNMKKQKISSVSHNQDKSSPSDKQVADMITRKLQDNDHLNESERNWLVSFLQTSKTNKPEEQRPRNTITKMLDKKMQTEGNLFANPNEIISENSGMDPVKEMKLLFKEKKKGGNKDRISELMDTTFPERRDLILRVRPLVIQVKELYPWLFSYEEIKNELDRLLKVQASDIFCANVSKYSPRILQSSFGPLKKKIIDAANAAETSKQKKYIEETGSLLLLPCVVKEKHSFLIMNTKKTSSHVFIRPPSSCKEILDILTCAGSYQVVVEERVICEPVSLSDALLAMMACFFIFNIQYTGDSHATFTLLESLYLEVPEEFATPSEEIPKKTKEKAHALKLIS